MTLEPSVFNTPNKREFRKSISIPSSKSYANRLLVLAALSEKEALVKNLPLSSDVETMIQCLNKMGLDCERKGNDVLVKNTFPDCEKEDEETIVLETGDGGTTNRFILPLLALGKREYELRASGHMRLRPMDSLVRALRSCGVAVNYNPVEDQGQKWIVLKGPVDKETTEVEIDCSQTTQFLTGLSLAFSRSSIKIIPKNLTVSLPYWHLTQALIEKAKTEKEVFENPVDFSSVSYPLALAAVLGEVTLTNCHETDENQADSKFIPLLERMGAKITWSEEGLKCEKNELKGIEFDGSQCPDVIPTLIFVCSFAEGESLLTNLEVLTHKECDRYEEMIHLLEAANVTYEANREDYSLKIIGRTFSDQGFDFKPVDDHRMVMVTYLFQRALGGGTILDNSHHVKKSFANFFDVMS